MRSGHKVGKAGSSVTTLVSDTFTRASDTTNLGIADTGQSWANFGAPRWTITANQANPFQTLTRLDGASIDALSANGTVQFTQNNSPAAGPGIVFRLVDALNYWIWWGSGATTQRLSKYIAGVETAVGADDAVVMAAGVLWAVTVNAANLITLKRNGVTIRSVTDAQHSAATRYGMGGPCGTGDLFDNFTVTTP